MRVEHRRHHHLKPSTTKLIHRIDTDESYGTVEIVLPNGQRLELMDAGTTNAIEVRVKPDSGGPYVQLAVEPVMGNIIRLRAGEKTPL